MTGKTFGGFEVLSEAPNVFGTARWRCRHTCGAFVVLDGIQLRAKPPKYCASCRPAHLRNGSSAP